MTRQPFLLLCGFLTLTGCAKEPPPRSVSEFVESPILLEAAMVRCSQDRSKTRYDPECINARQAVSRIQAKEEAEARAALEARSENKRAALRRTQAAAAEARRRAAEVHRQREEAEYLAQFGVLPPGDEARTEPLDEGNLPIAVVPDAPTTGSGDGSDADAYVDDGRTHDDSVATPATDAGNPEPVAPDVEPEGSDLDSIRDELRRRNEEGG